VTGTWARCRRIAIAVICLFGSVAVAGAAFAARLVDVRVGVHPGFTRIVFETDTKTTYDLQPKEDELVVQLDAAGAAEAITARSGQLMWVRVEPAGASTGVRIQVKGTVEVRQMILTGPDRIVLDLYPSTAAPVATTAPKPTPTRAPVPTPAPEAAPTPAPVAEADPTTAPDPAPVAEAEPVPSSAPDPAPDLASEPSAAPAAEEASPEPSEDPLYPEEAAGDVPIAETDVPAMPDASEAPTSDLAADAPMPADPAEPAASEPDAVERPWVEPTAPEPDRDGGLIGLLLSPVGLGGLAMLFLVVFLLLRRRGGGEEVPDADPLDVFAGDEPGEADEAVSFADAGDQAEAVEAGIVVPEEEDLDVDRDGPDNDLEAEDSLFDVAEDEFALAPVPAEGTKPTVAAVGAAASIASDGPPAEWVEEYGEEMARIIQELESRVSHLETRLEEVLDSKERLERQVSAQTEELRVQRAAIARTQRVLRTVNRADDEASEPAPKV